MRKFSRIFGAMGVAVAAVAMATSPAQASDSWGAQIDIVNCAYCSEIGEMTFMSDPTDTSPGDAMRVCDRKADGLGIKAWMWDPNGTLLRTATTQGHDAPYCSPWATGDLPEGKHIVITACAIKGRPPSGARK